MSEPIAAARDGFLDGVHPLTKVAAAAALTAACLALRSPWALFILALPVGLAASVSAHKLRLRHLLFLLPLGIVAGGNYAITGSAAEAARYGLRLLVLLGGIPICALNTRPADLARALAQLRLPAGVVLAVTLVWRFIPVLADQAAAIREVNLLRGPSQGGLRTAARRWVIPLAFAAADYAERTSLALELRGFDPAAPRTLYRAPRFGWRDGLVAAIVLATLTSAAASP